MGMLDERPEFKLSDLAQAIIKPLESSADPRDIMQVALIKMVDSVQQEVKWQTPHISEIKDQTKKTNGRVDEGEKKSRENELRIIALESDKVYVRGMVKAITIGGVIVGLLFKGADVLLRYLGHG